MKLRQSRRQRRRGITLVELVLTLAIVLTLAVFLGFSVRRPIEAHRLESCKQRLQWAYQGLHMYRFGYFAEYFPYAWHVGGPSLEDDLGNLTYYRFLIREHAGSDFRRIVTSGDLDRAGGDRRVAQREKFRTAQEFWSDPARGWTNDYFAPQLLFPLPEGKFDPEKTYSDYSRATTDVPPPRRPVFADVNASFPNPQARDPGDPGHEQEMTRRTGSKRSIATGTA